MKLNQLIQKLLYLRELHGDVEVIIDHDENGWFTIEELEKTDYDGETMINIISSNEV